jgi:hypothetical protein
MLDYLRILVATVCFALFVYGFAEYVDFPKGATATLKGLMGFVALGLVPWIAPPNFASTILRIVGTIISVVALALFALLYGRCRTVFDGWVIWWSANLGHCTFQTATPRVKYGQYRISIGTVRQPRIVPERGRSRHELSCLLWVIHDRVEPTMGPVVSAVLRLRPIFVVHQNFEMCQMRSETLLASILWSPTPVARPLWGFAEPLPLHPGRLNGHAGA